MSTQEIKRNITTLIEQIENPQILEDIYSVLERLRSEKPTIDFWDLFTREQQLELERTWEESENEEMLINHEQAMKEAHNYPHSLTQNNSPSSRQVLQP